MTVERFSSHEVLESFRLCISVLVVNLSLPSVLRSDILHACRQSYARHSSVIESDLVPKAASMHREYSFRCASPPGPRHRARASNHMKIRTLQLVDRLFLNSSTPIPKPLLTTNHSRSADQQYVAKQARVRNLERCPSHQAASGSTMNS